MFTLQPTPSAISTVPWSAGALIDRLPTLDDINHKGKVLGTAGTNGIHYTNLHAYVCTK